MMYTLAIFLEKFLQIKTNLDNCTPFSIFENNLLSSSHLPGLKIKHILDRQQMFAISEFR